LIPNVPERVCFLRLALRLKYHGHILFSSFDWSADHSSGEALLVHEGWAVDFIVVVSMGLSGHRHDFFSQLVQWVVGCCRSDGFPDVSVVLDAPGTSCNTSFVRRVTPQTARLEPKLLHGFARH
jgi:hypothetical protein